MIYGTHNGQVLEDWRLEYISPVRTSKLDELYTQFHRSVTISPGTHMTTLGTLTRIEYV